MVDCLIAFLAFFLAFQLSAALLVPLLRWLAGVRGLSLIVLPVFVGLGLAGLSVFSHFFGNHASSDIDFQQSGPLAAWLIVALIVLAVRLAVSLLRELRVTGMLWAATRELDASLVAKVSEALSPSRETGCPVPRLRFHASSLFYEPFIRGLLDPVIYLHVDLVKRLSVNHLRAVLFHELGHKRRGDQWVTVLYTVFLKSLGVSRTLRYGYEEWLESSERHCDDFASRVLGSGRPVAEALVEVLRFSSGGRAPMTSSALCGHRALEGRVARLLSADRDGGRWVFDATDLMSGICLLLGLVALTSFMVPDYGLELYCFLEHLVGTHCIGWE